jgi:hypothetical protein
VTYVPGSCKRSLLPLCSYIKIKTENEAGILACRSFYKNVLNAGVHKRHSTLPRLSLISSSTARWKQGFNNFECAVMRQIIFSISVMLLSITGFAQQFMELSQQEKDAILYMREEEKLARDVYDSLYAKWGGNPFGNIRKSEQIHMDRMKSLINTYKLQDPVEKNKDKHGDFSNDLLQKYYKELVSTGSNSLTEALKAGAKIEELDISDLEERLKQTKKLDIVETFNYLKLASENHLRAFVRKLKMQGVNYEPVFLSKDRFDIIIAAENNNKGGKKR